MMKIHKIASAKVFVAQSTLDIVILNEHFDERLCALVDPMYIMPRSGLSKNSSLTTKI